MTHRILVTDEIDPEGVALLRDQPTFEVVEVPTTPAEQLAPTFGEFDAFIGRSATRLPGDLLRHASRLRVIGRAGVGTDNIDIPTATSLGIAIINAPAGNTVSVAELFFGVVIGLLRELPRAATSMREGRWDRSQLIGEELRGKRLLIVGVGRIGGEVAQRALSFGMDVTGYDPYVGAERFEALRVQRVASLVDAMREADIVTVHTPLTEETRGLIGADELAALSPRAILVNMARGGIVDEPALVAALQAKALRAAAVDVFEREPLAADSPLRTLPNVLLTPHLGANTVEGQRNVAVDVCAAVRDALLSDDYSRAINLPGGTEAPQDRAPILLARRAAAVARALLADRGATAVERISLRCGPEFAELCPVLLSSAAAGALEAVLNTDRLNLINARSLAEGRGIELSGSVTTTLGHDRAVQVTLSGGTGSVTIAGVAVAGAPGRLTRIADFHVDVAPRQTLVILTNKDVPGVIGHVGTALGQAGVNIAEYHQARLARGGEALATIAVDGEVAESLRQELCALPDVIAATVVRFRDA